MKNTVRLPFGAWFIEHDGLTLHGIDNGCEIKLSESTKGKLEMVSGNWRVGRQMIRPVFVPSIYLDEAEVQLEDIQVDNLKFGKDYDIVIFFDDEDDATLFSAFI